MLKKVIFTIFFSFSYIIPSIVLSDHHERAGTCEDTKLQVEYFCNEANALVTPWFKQVLRVGMQNLI